MSLSQERTQELLSLKGNEYTPYHRQTLLNNGTLFGKMKDQKGLWLQMAKHAQTVAGNTRVTEVLPKATPGTTFVTSNIIEFVVPKLQVQKQMDFEVSLTNADGSNAWNPTLCPWFWIDNIQILQKGVVKQEIRPEDIRDRFIYLKRDLQDRQVMSSANYGVNSATYVTNASLAASASGTFRINIPSVLDGMYIENLEETIVRVTPSPIANWSSDTGENPDVTITGAKLRIVDVQVDENTRKRLRHENSTHHDKRVLLPTQELQTVSLSTSSTPVVMRNFNDTPYVAFATIEIYDPANAYNRNTLLPLTSLSLAASSGTVVDGITWSSANNLTYLAPQTFEKNSFYTQATYPYIYLLPGACIDGFASLSQGIHTGGIAFDRDMQLNLVAPSSYASHTLLIRVHAYRHVRVSNGVINVL